MLKHDTKNNIRIRSPRFGKLSVGHRDQREKSPDFSEVLLLLIFMGIFFAMAVAMNNAIRDTVCFFRDVLP